MTIYEIVAVVVAVLTSVVRFFTINKEFWSKVPALVKYVPGALVVLTVLGEKLAGVKTESDLVNAGVALALMGYAYFSKPKAA